MAVHTFSTDSDPSLFLEQADSAGKPVRLPAGSQVFVRNAVDGTPLSATASLDLGYLDFTTNDVPGVTVSGDKGATWKGPFWSKEARAAAASGALPRSNYLTVGEVDTLQPGQPATASVTGYPPAQALNLGIPQGATGTGTPYELRGTGSPLGVVTPTGPGITYTDTAGTCGAWRWMSTGTTSSSWVVITGDTGWRDVSGLLDPGLQVSSSYGYAKLRRTGRTVTASMRLDVIGATTKIFASTFPAGFGADKRQAITCPGVLLTAAGSTSLPTNPSWSSYIGGNGTSLRIANYTIGWMLALFWSWETDDPWPTVLPGSPS